MKRTIAVSLALAAVLLGTGTPSAASAQDYGRDRDYRGDQNRGWGDRNTGMTNLEGRWIARRGYSLPASYSRWSADAREIGLPPRMVIDQRRNVIRVENFNGRVVQEILVGGRRANRDDYVYGQWNGSKLMTVRSGYGNARIIQTFSLSNRGRRLVVYTRRDAPGTRNDAEFTNVYQRA